MRDTEKESAINQFLEAFSNLTGLSIDALPSSERRRVQGSLINATIEAEGGSVRCRIWAQGAGFERTLLTIILDGSHRRNGYQRDADSCAVE